MIKKKHIARTEGKRVVLKGYFHVSSQELCDVLAKAKKATKEQAKKNAKTKGKTNPYKTKSEGDIEEKAKDESDSKIGDYIMVDIE